MTTMHSFYRQFSRPAQSSAYLNSLAALAQFGLAQIRSLTFGIGWELWG